MFRIRLFATSGVALIGAAATALGFPAAARAETAADAPAATAATTSLGDVVVTARRVNENLQRVPVAVTVVSPKVLEGVGVFQPQDLANLTPGLQVTATTSDRNNVVFAIRGQSYSYGNLFPAVITYFNEVPITQLGHGQFFDLQNVQILRGPQGVLFGRVTDGGNVMVYARKPSNQVDGFVETKFGNYGLLDFTGALNVPIIPDRLMVRGAMEISRRSGFTTNYFNGQKLDDVAYESYRLGVVFKPLDNLENDTTVAYERTHENGTAVELEYINTPVVTGSVAGLAAGFGSFYGINSRGDVVPAAPGLTPFTAANYIASLQSQINRQHAIGPRAVYDDSPLFDRRENLYIVNATTLDLHVVTLKNIFGYTKVTDFEAQNFAGGNGALILPCHSGCQYGSQSFPFNSQEQFSEELRIAGKSFGDRLNWSAGFYTDYQHPAVAFENYTINIAILQRNGVQITKSWSVAGFANAEYDLNDLLSGLKINAGIRYTADRVHSDTATYLAPIPSPGIPGSTSVPHGVCVSYASAVGASTCADYRANFNALTGTAGASYQFAPTQMAYAKVSRGYRPGGVNGTAPPSIDPNYLPEFDLSVEIGLKSDFNFDGVKLRTNLALFHDNYTKIQQLIVLPGSVPVSIVRNVDDAIIQGVEFEGTLVPFRGMTLGLDYAYTDARYKHLATDGPQNPQNPCDITLKNIAGFCSANMFGFTPKHQLGLTADYDLPFDSSIGVISVGATFHYQSESALTTTSVLNPHAIEPAYGILDLRATWRQIYGHPIDLSFFMTNVTNKLYRTGTDDLEAASSVGSQASIYAPPRMFGFGLKYRFGASAGS